MTDINILNGAIFNALDSSVQISIGNGLSFNASTDVYTASANSYGNLSYFDTWTNNNWDGTPISQVAVGQGDVTAIHTVIESGSPANVFEYGITTGGGPQPGLVGAEVVGWNSTGVLADVLYGLVLGGNPQVTTTSAYIIFSSADLSFSDGSGPTAAELAFGTTGAFPAALGVPEPSVAMLMPVMIIGLMIARLPSVRAYLRGL
jgi:hypothetical protein